VLVLVDITPLLEKWKLENPTMDCRVAHIASNKAMKQFSLPELRLEPFVKLHDFFGSLTVGVKFLRG
jgi:hypothetical protein